MKSAWEENDFVGIQIVCFEVEKGGFGWVARVQDIDAWDESYENYESCESCESAWDSQGVVFGMVMVGNDEDMVHAVGVKDGKDADVKGEKKIGEEKREWRSVGLGMG